MTLYNSPVALRRDGVPCVRRQRLRDLGCTSRVEPKAARILCRVRESTYQSDEHSGVLGTRGPAICAQRPRCLGLGFLGEKSSRASHRFCGLRGLGCRVDLALLSPDNRTLRRSGGREHSRQAPAVRGTAVDSAQLDSSCDGRGLLVGCSQGNRSTSVNADRAAQHAAAPDGRVHPWRLQVSRRRSAATGGDYPA
jgi:hypothetical protein